MNHLAHPVVIESKPAKWRGLREDASLSPLLRKDVASNGPTWLPLLLVLGAIATVGYADHRVASISLIYLYILPLTFRAIFLRKEISYGLIGLCILFHYFDSPRHVGLGLRLFHDISALLCFTSVVYTIQRQRDDLLKDVGLAAQVQRLFLPLGKPAIAGLEISGMMEPARGVGGDYYNYIPINAHTSQIVIADVSGKGVPAALLMSATAAAMQLEASQDRNMLEQVRRLNTGIHSVSGGEHYVTLLLAEIDTQKRALRYVNCGHNPALLFQAQTGTVTRLNSSCAPIGMFQEELCEVDSVDLTTGDVLAFYTDGVTEAENQLGEEFGTERLSAVLGRNASLSAKGLMKNIFSSTAEFCREVGFNDDVTILVVKCNFDGTQL